MIACLYCHQEVIFEATRGGWIHAATGKLYVTRVDAEGHERDDHAAMPSYS